jgi:hypothetical protein
MKCYLSARNVEEASNEVIGSAVPEMTGYTQLQSVANISILCHHLMHFVFIVVGIEFIRGRPP